MEPDHRDPLIYYLFWFQITSQLQFQTHSFPPGVTHMFYLNVVYIYQGLKPIISGPLQHHLISTIVGIERNYTFGIRICFSFYLISAHNQSVRGHLFRELTIKFCIILNFFNFFCQSVLNLQHVFTYILLEEIFPQSGIITMQFWSKDQTDVQASMVHRLQSQESCRLKPTQ